MKVALIGRTEILYVCIKKFIKDGHEIVLIITSKEAPEYKKTSSDFEMIAKKLKIPFAKGLPITKHKKLISKSKAEIAASINYSSIIPQEIIDEFPLGILNAHGGDLPRYRGNACQAWAIINGEEKIGLCIHKMVGDELDSGNIIEREYLPIDLNTKIEKVLNWMGNRIPDLFSSAITKLEDDKNYFLEKQSLNLEDCLRCYPRKPEDARIKWESSAIDILRLINASNKPYSGAFCYFNEEKITIWDAEILINKENFNAVPGQVIKLNSDSVVISCGDGCLLIKKTQIKEIVGNPRDSIKSIRDRLE
jgi:UDP-4-amino-4-deoxy-L-arabinose formyltransferase/UDP-glucuronic acid dehydrogenase (UDP-4-keto-hexauronic acid decarboxylating)